MFPLCSSKSGLAISIIMLRFGESTFSNTFFHKLNFLLKRKSWCQTQRKGLNLQKKRKFANFNETGVNFISFTGIVQMLQRRMFYRENEYDLETFKIMNCMYLYYLNILFEILDLYTIKQCFMTFAVYKFYHCLKQNVLE